MNNSQQTIRVGLFFVLGLALTWVTFATLSGGSIFKPQGYRLIAGFESLKELKAGDEVRMAGVKVGAVEQTRRRLLADLAGLPGIPNGPGVFVIANREGALRMELVDGEDAVGPLGKSASRASRRV